MPHGQAFNAFTIATQPTLKEVADAIAADDSLAPQRRRNLLSSIRALARLMDRDLKALPAHPAFYRPFFKSLHPEQCGVTLSRIRNIRSDLRFALRHIGCISRGHGYMAPLASEWQALWDAAESMGRSRYYMARLMRYCSAHGVAPVGVDDTVSQRFLSALIEESFLTNPVKTHQGICRLWNRAAREVPGWPPTLLTVPRYRETYTIPLDRLPESLRSEIAEMVACWSGRQLLDDRAPAKPLAPRTIASRLYRLRQVVTALVHQGRPMEEIVSLAQITELDAAKSALRYHLDRNDGATSSQIHSLAILIKTIARHWVGVDEAQLDALRSLCSRVEPRQQGLTQKNRERLRQFDTTRNIALLLRFPQRRVKAIRSRDRGRRREAVGIQIALAVELLLMAPIRLANLVAIDLDHHILRTRAGRGGKVHLVIPGTEVKNGEPLEFELLPATVRLLDLYLRDYHPRLSSIPSRSLFPNDDGVAKTGGHLGDQIAKHVFKDTGLRVNTHLFRHLAAKLYLDRNPGGYEVVRRLLGHRSMDTTIRFYAGLETAAAGRHFDEEILKLRASLPDIDDRVRPS